MQVYLRGLHGHKLAARETTRDAREGLTDLVLYSTRLAGFRISLQVTATPHGFEMM